MPKMSIKRGTRKREDAPEKDNSALVKAREAVGEFESVRDDLEDMRDAFEENFPEASKEIHHIRQVEDEVLTLIDKAKLAVRDAKVSVGDFKLTRKFSRAGYDDKEFLDAIIRSKNKDLLFDLVKTGVIASVKVDGESSRVYFERDEGAYRVVKDAWREKAELTPSVKVPKI